MIEDMVMRQMEGMRAMSETEMAQLQMSAYPLMQQRGPYTFDELGAMRNAYNPGEDHVYDENRKQLKARIMQRLISKINHLVYGA